MSRGGDERLRQLFPLHWSVFVDDQVALASELEKNIADVDKKDPRGRTPLMLAVTLGHEGCARSLLDHGADANAQNAGMWAVSHEAISFGDPDLLRLVLTHRERQRAVRTKQAMIRLLNKLKIYKRGSDVRIDTTLVGFDSSSNWQRGHQSFIFSFSADQSAAQLIVLDHDKREAQMQTLGSVLRDVAGSAPIENISDDGQFEPTEAAIVSRLTSPIATTFVDVDRIGFERSKTGGLLSWISSSDRTEDVAGYECKVYSASNVNLVTKTRTEHLTAEDKERYKRESAEGHPIQSLFRFMERRESQKKETSATDSYGGLSASEYLDSTFDLDGQDIGRPKEINEKINTFQATMWLSDRFPLSLQEQISPIIDLMAVSNAHFARLNNFIQLQLPAGFPVKIEIPFFHVVSARITFGRVNEPGPHVNPADFGVGVEIDPQLFEIPPDYRMYDENRPATNVLSPAVMRDDDLYLQWAIEQSMASGQNMASGQSMASGQNNPPVSFVDPGLPTYEEDQFDMDLRRALRASLNVAQGGEEQLNEQVNDEDELERVLRLSRKEAEQEAAELQRQQRELDEAIELSLIDK